MKMVRALYLINLLFAHDVLLFGDGTLREAFKYMDILEVVL